MTDILCVHVCRCLSCFIPALLNILIVHQIMGACMFPFVDPAVMSYLDLMSCWMKTLNLGSWK